MDIKKTKNGLRVHTIETKIRELATIWLHVFPYFKYNDYQYEKEFRMICNVFYGMELLNNQRPIIIKENKVKPYIEVPVPIESIKGIIIGSDANYGVM